MAPELILRKPYIGSQIDVFALGVCLFIMYSGTPPFNEAKPDEFYYRCIYHKKHDIFWKHHAKGKPSGMSFFSDEFKSLM